MKKGKIYKFFENSEESGFIESLQEIEYIEEKKKFKVKFLNKKIGYENKKIPKEKIQSYLNYLKDFNLEVFLELEWDTTLYKKGSHYISLGFVKSKLNNKEKITFMTSQKFEDEEIIQKLKLSGLEEPVLAYTLK